MLESGMRPVYVQHHMLVTLMTAARTPVSCGYICICSAVTFLMASHPPSRRRNCLAGISVKAHALCHCTLSYAGACMLLHHMHAY